jgi:hypothetical protein
MSDKEHLKWIHDRIVNVYGENENVDFLIRMREIIQAFNIKEPKFKQINQDNPVTKGSTALVKNIFKNKKK